MYRVWFPGWGACGDGVRLGKKTERGREAGCKEEGSGLSGRGRACSASDRAAPCLYPVTPGRRADPPQCGLPQAEPRAADGLPRVRGPCAEDASPVPSHLTTPPSPVGVGAAGEHVGTGGRAVSGRRDAPVSRAGGLRLQHQKRQNRGRWLSERGLGFRKRPGARTGSFGSLPR